MESNQKRKDMNRLDDEGYPMPDFIDDIINWTPSKSDFSVLLVDIIDSWHHGDYGYKIHEERDGVTPIELHTLGWSGNEELVNAINNNIYITHLAMKYLCWKTGGHYYYVIISDKEKAGNYYDTWKIINKC